MEVCFLIVFFFRNREGVVGALGLLPVSWGTAPMAASMLRPASSVGAPALGAAPLSVSRSVAVGARKIPAFALSLLAARKLRDLVMHTLVKTTPVNLHELLFDDLEAPSLPGEVGGCCALSSFEAARSFHFSDNRKLERRGEVGQKSAQPAKFGPNSGEFSRDDVAQIS